MKKSHRTATTAVFLAAVFTSTAPAAIAIPPVDDDPIIICPRGYVLRDDVCVKLPPPPPANSPAVALDLARQSTARTSIRVTGSATDADAPQTALTVRISVDGVLVKTVLADRPSDPVATQGFVHPPPVGGTGHRYDTSVTASANAQNVCVTAVNIGSGSNKTVCRNVDRVVEFAAHSISYDTQNAQITAASLDQLDKVTNTNSTNVQQSTTISGSKTVTDTQGWSDTVGVKVTVSGGVKIPFISDFKVTVEGSASFTQNGSTSSSRTFSWSQPVLVPAKSKVVATVAITKTTLVVPYSLTGEFVYASGARVAGTTAGTYSGVNGHDLEVTLTQFNLDGTPAASPVDQPAATLLQSS